MGVLMSPTSPTLQLLRIIGSPFYSDHYVQPDLDKEDAIRLYNYAIKNKIGFSFLEALKNQESLEILGLGAKYAEEIKKHNNQLLTIRRVSQILNSYGVNYAIFKSIMPFSATPNDVDMIHFGSDTEYEYAAQALLKSNYLEVKGEADAQQRMFHDISLGGYVNPHKGKDIFDIDLYQKISASQLLYLNKKTIEKNTKYLNISGDNVRVLDNETELVSIIIHSIFPEMLCTLQAYYATLYYLKQLDAKEINKFLLVAKENNVLYAVKAHFSLAAELHKVAYGLVPEKIEDLLLNIGNEKSERMILARNNFKMPHMYSMITIMRVLFEKSKEPEFDMSIISQLLFMLNPKSAKWVLYNILWRRTRETY
jgi:hypothetical protein